VKEKRHEARLSICTLGPLQVTLGGSPVTAFESDKARALLVYLAVEADRPHRRETLAGLLWPESPERAARTNLRGALANLRRVIGDRGATLPVLDASRLTIRFNPEGDVWVDVTAFARWAERRSSGPAREQFAGRVSRDSGHESTNIRQLDAAVALYRGPFLEGFSLSDCPGFEEWALLKREQLRRQTLQALHHLAEGYEAQGDLERALRRARRAVDLDPWREETQRQLMRVLALSGQRTAALAQYEVCRRTLAEELGVEPEEETTSVYRQIKAGEVSMQSTGPQAVPNNLPVPLTPFVGRKRELEELRDRLRDRDCRLLTVVGPGGIGKTRLAIELAQRLIQVTTGQRPFQHGVFFVPLAPVGAGDALVPTIAHILDLSFVRDTHPNPGRRDEAEPRIQLLNYLRDKELMLVLDNFEHLLSLREEVAGGEEGGGTYLLTEILCAAPGVKMLITSRMALNLRSEWLYPVEGMAFPRIGDVDGKRLRIPLEDYAAVALFEQSARRVCPAFSLEQERDAVVRICQLVEGMPLALELAASWIKVLSPAGVVAELERGLDILATSLRDVEPRHRSMRAVFDHSWRLLSDAEQRVLRFLSVFRGGFRLSAAQPVSGASLPILSGLVEKSLLRASPPGRYQMHELFRQFVLERLQSDRQEEQGVRNRHCEYYARFLQMRGEALKGSEQPAALAEMEIEIENARAAWNWAAQQRRVNCLNQALEGLCLFYEQRLRTREGQAACRIAAEKLAAALESDALRLLARLLAWQSAFFPPENAGTAGALLEQSMGLLERPELAGEDTRRERAFVLRQMGNSAFAADLEQARSFYEASLVLYRSLQDHWWTARNLEQLGWLAAYQGAYEEAILHHRESLDLRRKLGDRRGIAESYRGLAIVALPGQIEDAMQSVRECIAIWRQLGDRSGIAGGLNQLAPGLILTGSYAEAFTVLEESLAICTDLGLRWSEAWVNLWRGFAELHTGHYRRAQGSVEKALPFSREMGDYEYVGRSLWLLGDVALAREAYGEAAGLLKESVASYGAYGLPNEWVWALADLAVAERGVGKSDRALGHMCEALRTAIAVRAVLSLFWIVPKAALFLVDLGKVERAVEVYALALRSPGVVKSRWFEQVVGRHIVAAAGTLLPEFTGVLQTCGESKGLGDTARELLEEL
jgi:DNA-binding SARP family transcriptional activator/predicted ATPase